MIWSEYLAEIEARWVVHAYNSTDCYEADDARTDIPRLVQRVRELEEALAKYGNKDEYARNILSREVPE